jgi:hypothetical protein
MTKFDQLPGPMMRRGTGLHANQAGGLFLEEGQHLGSPQLPAEHNRTFPINTVDLKNVLRKIDTYCDNFLHGWLLFPCGSQKPHFGTLRCRRVGAVHCINFGPFGISLTTAALPLIPDII